MKNMDSNKGIGNFFQKKPYLTIFLLSLILRQFMIGGTAAIRCASDDIGYLAAPSYLAGLDWSSVLSIVSYYGAAWYVLFTPVLKFISNPLLIWWILIEANMLCAVAATLFSYWIAVKKLGMAHRWQTIVCVLIASCCMTSSRSLSDEHIIFFLTWVLVFFLSELSFDRKNYLNRKNLLMIPLISAVMLYAYLCHSRNIVFFVVFFCVVIFASLYCRNWKGAVFLGIYSVIWEAVFYKLAAAMQKGLLNILFRMGERESQYIRNASVNAGSLLDNLTSLRTIRVSFDVLLSNFLTAIFGTYGLIILVLLLMLLSFFLVMKKSGRWHPAEMDFRLLWFSGLCFLVGIIALSIKTGGYSVSTYWSAESNSNYKGFFYFRYYGTYLGPALLVALKALQRPDIRSCRICKALASIAAVGVPVYVFLVVYGNLGDKSYVNNLPGLFSYDGDGTDWQNIIVMIVIECVFVYILFYTKWRYEYLLVMMLVCLFVPYVRNGPVYIPVVNEYSDAGRAAIQFLEENDMLAEHVYCQQEWLICRYQYILYDIPVIYGLPESNGDENVIIGCWNISLPGYYTLQLDDNEFIFTTDEEVYQFLVSNGYGLTAAE